MKKLIYSSLLLVAIAFSAQAQNISKNALGLRLGDNDGFGAEISYQRKLQKNNRLELDLGIRNNKYADSFKLVGLYQWVWNIEGGFNWYAGIGAGIGSWKYGDLYKEDFKKYNPNYYGGYNYGNGGTYAVLAGDLGIEYNFDFPLQVSLDFRPEFVLGNGYGRNYGSDIGLGLRYKFN